MNIIKENKLTIISKTFAPFVIGSPILLNNMISYYKGKVSAISGWSADAQSDDKFKPACDTSYLKMPFNFIQKIFDKYIFHLVPIIEIFILINLKRNRSGVVLLVFNPTPEFLIAGYRACKKLSIPYLIHVHDLWEENVADEKKQFAKKWEKIILEESSKIL